MKIAMLEQILSKGSRLFHHAICISFGFYLPLANPIMPQDISPSQHVACIAKIPLPNFEDFMRNFKIGVPIYSMRETELPPKELEELKNYSRAFDINKICD